MTGYNKVLCRSQRPRNRRFSDLLPDGMSPPQTMDRPEQLRGDFARNVGATAEDVKMIHVRWRHRRQRDTLYPLPGPIIRTT